MTRQNSYKEISYNHEKSLERIALNIPGFPSSLKKKKGS